MTDALDMTITDADVARDEAEAREAADLVAALEERVAEGDGNVTPEEITAQESISRFARLRAEGTRRKAVRAAEARRQAALADLRARVDKASFRNGHRAAELLKAVKDAEEDYIAHADGFNAQLSAWRREAGELGVRTTNQSVANEAIDQGLLDREALGALVVGDRMVQALPGAAQLAYLRQVSGNDAAPMYAALEALDGLDR